MNKKLLVLFAMMLAASSSAATDKDPTSTSTSLDQEVPGGSESSSSGEDVDAAATTAAAIPGHRVLEKRKTRTEYYGCRQSCFNVNPNPNHKNPRCKRKCEVRNENHRAFCKDGKVPPKCRKCCDHGPETEPETKPETKPETGAKQCYQHCSNFDPRKKCDPNDCSLCKVVGGIQHLCVPDCGEKCQFDAQCAHAGGCSKCISGKCKPPEPQIRIHSQSSFMISVAPYNHYRRTVEVGSACHPGCKRHRATVVGTNPAKLACGGESDSAGMQWKTMDQKDCTLKIPYCRHGGNGAGRGGGGNPRCRWKIYEECT